jgi:two-component system chemotaxis response regulator CheY
MAQVLVIDDSSTVRTEVGSFLTSQGLNVGFAVDGRDGLAKLRADAGVKLVLCDVTMPNMDG